MESEKGQVKCGVPQGSVLGPLFFLIYVNDMVRASKDLELVLFADDTNIFVKGGNYRELFEKVNRGLAELAKWFQYNKLTLNLKKTEYVYFGGQGPKVVPAGGVNIGGESIRRVEGVRFLGVWVDEELRWSSHIGKVKSKVSQLVGILGRAAGVIGGPRVLSLYNALVLPHLQYCLKVWGDFQEGRNVKMGEALLRFQKRIAGIIAGERGRFHADPLFSRFGIIKIGDLYKQQLRIYGWRFWNNRLPAGQAAMLRRVSSVHCHNTRASRNELFMSTQDQRSISYRVPKEWQVTIDGLKSNKALGSFKKKSKQGFLAGYKAFSCQEEACFVCRSMGADG